MRPSLCDAFHAWGIGTTTGISTSLYAHGPTVTDHVTASLALQARQIVG